MLIHLSIHNYTIVDHLELEFRQGMTVVTGETGAGKSIILDALGLALGHRAESHCVHPKANKADILATFDLQKVSTAKNWLHQNNYIDSNSDDICILRRIINPEGRTRCAINSKPCTVKELKHLSNLLLNLHGQHEHQSLLKPETQQQLLDSYAQAQPLVKIVNEKAKQWNEIRQQLHQIRSDNENQAKQELFSYQLDELNKLALGEEEVSQLENEQKILASSHYLRSTCQELIEQCSDNEASILSLLARNQAKITKIQDKPKSFVEVELLFNSAQVHIEEAVTELKYFLDNFDSNPDRLDDIENRLDTIYTLARKHKIKPEQLPEKQQQLTQALLQVANIEQSSLQLSEKLTIIEKEYLDRAKELTKYRQLHAITLAEKVTEKIHLLGMPEGKFIAQLTPNSDSKPKLQGLESVHFLVQTNPGHPLKSIEKIASGGELSRISLAIQVATADTSKIPTLVFDEVDVGIGGPTAETVGQLLRQLGANGQILSVTHLPQVASQGHNHLHVQKNYADKKTQIKITQLSIEQRIEEVSRMLGGLKPSKESIAHARHMVTQSIT
ncbi:UNVERIFIED_CONTAM: hypothetical protein GTU68_056351 [Idotea baltica]|nr:hypothetical protein [Idotea baltica]